MSLVSLSLAVWNQLVTRWNSTLLHSILPFPSHSLKRLPSSPCKLHSPMLHPMCPGTGSHLFVKMTVTDDTSSPSFPITMSGRHGLIVNTNISSYSFSSGHPPMSLMAWALSSSKFPALSLAVCSLPASAFGAMPKTPSKSVVLPLPYRINSYIISPGPLKTHPASSPSSF